MRDKGMYGLSLVLAILYIVVGNGKVVLASSPDYVEHEVVIACQRKQVDFRRKGGTGNGTTELEQALSEEPICNLSHILSTDRTADNRDTEAGGNRKCLAGKAGGDAEGLDFYVATLEEGVSVESMVERLRQKEDIYWAEPNYLCRMMDESGYPFEKDELVDGQWYQKSMEATRAWAALEDEGIMPGDGVTVAVIDTGVSLEHRDLIDNIWVNESERDGQEGVDDDQNGYVDDIYGVNMINYFHDMTDRDGHGTMMAGLIGMTAGNGRGAGVAYGAKIMPVKVSIDGNFGTDLAVQGIEYAVENGADVISMSFGTYYDSLLLREAIRNASGKCMLAAAAGNESRITDDVEIDGAETGNVYPAGYDAVVGVMAYAESGKLAPFSNWDSKVGEGVEYELAAPGSAIYTSSLRDSFGMTEGTSPATALTAGAMAVCRGIFGDREQYPAATLQKLFVNAMNHKMAHKATDTYTCSYRMVHLMDVLLMAQQEEILADKEPPVANNLTDEEAWRGDKINLLAYAEDNYQIENVTAYYRYPSEGIWRSAEMEKNEIGMYGAVIPSDFTEDDEVEYFIAVYDGTFYTHIGSMLSPRKVHISSLTEDQDSKENGNSGTTDINGENGNGGGNDRNTNQGATSGKSDDSGIKKIRPILKRKYRKKRKKAVLQCRVKGKQRITGYYIYRSNRKKTGYRLWKKIRKNSLEVKLTAKKKYYRIVAYVKCDQKIYRSKKSEVVMCSRS